MVDTRVVMTDVSRFRPIRASQSWMGDVPSSGPSNLKFFRHPERPGTKGDLINVRNRSIVRINTLSETQFDGSNTTWFGRPNHKATHKNSLDLELLERECGKINELFF